MPVEVLSLAVVGVAYPNKDGGNRRSEIVFCNPGEPVELRREPRNEFDEHAIAVFSARNFQIGYVSSQRAPFIAGLLRAGRELTAIFQELAPWGAVIRVGIDCMPTLPLPSTRGSGGSPGRGADPDHDGFWPDYIPPDD